MSRSVLLPPRLTLLPATFLPLFVLTLIVFSGLPMASGTADDVLISRQSYALQLIKWIEDGRLDARELTAAQVRQLQAFGDADIRKVIESNWGIVQDTPQARIDAIEHWRKQLTPARLAGGNQNSGAEIFKRVCANCHKLYGEGQTIAPDLTGANRSSLEYLLMNIIDPSAVVPKQFTTSVVALKEGRVITGVIVATTDQTIVVQTDKEQLTIAREDIEATRQTGKSLMPDGMLDSLTPEQVRDLLGFIMPKASGG